MANFNGTSGNDLINGTTGNDNINGLGGSDTLFGDAGNDKIDGGAGNDYLDGGSDHDDLKGGTANDTLLGGAGNDSLDGGANDDYLDAGLGDNRLWGGTGIDTLLAGSGNDELDGGADDDYLDASAGDNRLWGGGGADVLLAGSGNDRLDGGADNDFLDAGAGDNELLGGTGNDTLLSGSGNDTLNGGANDDYIDAGSGNNALSGDTGNDALVAGSGSDTMDGGANDDVLDAGGGNDVVFGATGIDTFIFRQSENFGATDDYDGGDGIDTLHLDLTLAELLDPALQLDLVNFFAFLAANTNSSGEATNAEFHFTAFDLTVDQIENLTLTVDGAPVDPHATAIFGDTEASLTEDDTFPATGTLTVFDLDSDEAHTQSVLNGASQNGYGTYSVDSDGNWSYTLDNGLVQNLAPDDQISDSFVVFSLDGTASTTVTVTVDGVNDAPTLLVNSNLVAFYDFDEVSGTTAHDQSGGHDGTIDGATYVPGVTGTALQFDGSGDSVIVSDSPDWNFGTGDFSIQFWVNFSSVPGGSAGGPDAVLVGQDEGGGKTNKFFISAYTGHLGFHVNSPTLGPQFFADTPFTPVVGEWYSIALTKSGSFYQFYINGEPGGSASQSFALPDADAPLTFGESEGFYFHGELDGVAVYHRALTQAEVLQTYQSGTAVAAGLPEVAEGGSYVITTADLNYIDPDDAAVDVTFSVSNQVNGTVKVNGSAATSFTGQQLLDGLVSFSHDGSQLPSASFDVSVEDGDEDGSVPVVRTLGLTVTPNGTTDIGGYDDFGRGVTLQADGKILLAGSSSNGVDIDFALVRYNDDGTLDASFGGDGRVVTSFGASDDNGFSVTLDGADRILVAGYTGSGASAEFAVARYNSDGSLDTSFDGDGLISTGLLGDDLGQSVKVQSDGKIVIGGYSFNGSSFDFSIVRYNDDGSLDTSFDGDGKVTVGIAFHDASYSIALQSDGKIVAAGHSLTGIGINDFAIVRYNTDGSLDTTFSGDGRVTTDFGGTNDVGQSVAVQADGKIVVAGISSTGPNADFAVVRYNADGSLDTSFDGDGLVKTGFGAGSDAGITVALQADGKILVAGSSFNGTDTDFAIVRYNIDGSLDTTFDGDGKVTTQIGASSDDGFGIAIQADGKIVVSGSSFNGSDYDFAVARYNTDGSLDTGFIIF